MAIRLLSAEGVPILPEIRALLGSEDPDLRLGASRILRAFGIVALVPDDVEAAHPACDFISSAAPSP